MKIKGIDISYCQRNVDYIKAKKEGVEFAIIRTGYGEKTDDMLDKHVKGCTNAGIKYGFYVYAVSQTPERAVVEAQHCLKSITGYNPEYPIFYDMEDARLEKLKREQITEIAVAFLEEIKKAGYYAAYYSNPAWLETYLNKKKLADYDLWLAAWTENPNKATKFDYGQKMWQWGLDNINGIGPVDGDLCYVDYPAIIKKGGYNNIKAESKEPEQPASDPSYINFTEVDKYYKCIGKTVKLRKYPSANAPILGTLEKNAVYHVKSELFESNKLKWLELNGGFSMYIDQIGDRLFEIANKPTEFKVGDAVEITKPYAGSSTSATAVNKVAIGGKRYIVRIVPNTNFPYQLGAKKGDKSSVNTTGFANADGIKASSI